MGCRPPGKETRYSLRRRLSGSPFRSGWARKISPHRDSHFRTVEPVASRYTDYAIPAHTYIYIYIYIYNLNFVKDVPIIYVYSIIIVIVVPEKKWKATISCRPSYFRVYKNLKSVLLRSQINAVHNLPSSTSTDTKMLFSASSFLFLCISLWLYGQTWETGPVSVIRGKYKIVQFGPETRYKLTSWNYFFSICTWWSRVKQSPIRWVSTTDKPTQLAIFNMGVNITTRHLDRPSDKLSFLGGLNYSAHLK
jgi:hypothetical protein